MTFPEAAIITGGVLSLSMAWFHRGFYVLFGWRREFAKISPLNARVLYTIHLALLLLFLAFGALSLVYWRELARAEGLAGGLTLAYSLFWLWRTVWQWAYFRPPPSARRTGVPAVHYTLVAIFAALCLAYLVPLVARWLA
jgi:asparagine N-glycosylation enzyme membrane subunit Stt3